MNPDILHVYPLNDFREHSCELSKTCWCNPDIDESQHGTLVTHHSMDRREEFETGQRKTC